MSESLHHLFPVLRITTAKERMQTGKILYYVSNQFQDRLAASWVSGCFVWLLHSRCWLQLSLLSRSQLLINPFALHISCVFPHPSPEGIIYLFFSRRFRLSRRCLHLPSILRQQHVPDMSDVPDLMNILPLLLLGSRCLVLLGTKRSKWEPESETCVWTHTHSHVYSWLRTCFTFVLRPTLIAVFRYY